MSANIKNIQYDVFRRIIDNDIVKRCQIRLTEEEFGILENTKYIRSVFFKDYGFVLLKTQEEVFVGISSSQECNLDGSDITIDFDCLETSAPYWMAIVYYGGLTLRNDVTESRVKELIDTDNDSNIIKYDFNELVPFFDSIAILRYKNILSEDIDPIHFLKKIAILVFLEHNQAQHLPLNENTINSYKKFYNNINLKHLAFPLDNIVRSILSSEWRYCYLDLYRCIERLFPIKQFSDTLDQLGTGISNKDLLNRFVLSRAREINQLDDICENVYQKNKNLYDAILNDGPSESEKKPYKAANLIYEVRNRIAHDQIDDYQFENDNQANDFICTLLEIINESYLYYQQYLEKIYPSGEKADKKYRIIPLS